MKYLYPLAIIVSIVLLGGLSASFERERALPLDDIQSQYRADLAAFGAALQDLRAAAADLDTTAQRVATLRATFQTTRHAYKRLEYLLAYLDPQAATFHLNGAPLPKLEPNVPEISVLPPSGLQPIDEIIFGDAPCVEKLALLDLLDKLIAQYTQVHAVQRSVYFSDRQVFEAMRFQLVRILSHGITGFDTPASLHALPEAHTSLQGLQAAVQPYLAYLKPQDADLARRVAALYTEALAYLEQHDDFDTFDRLHFVREYLNPLFKETLAVQQRLGIETIYEVSRIKHPVNYLATDLFSKDFLNKYYYIRLPPDQDSERLRELGRMLFYDPILSANNQRACASCHDPQRGFTDGRTKSLAFDGQGTIQRNAPTLLNSIHADRLFYDLRVDEFDLQVDHVVDADDEFHTDYATIAQKLNRSAAYRAWFTEVFKPMGAEETVINRSTINIAIMAYVKELLSYDSPFDQYVRREREDYPAAAARGFNLFMGKAACGTCHFAPTFSGLVPPLFEENEAEVIGVPATTDTLHPMLDPDLGKWASGRIKEIAPFHRHAFKTTTVRNVALTAPYMHNGVYRSLEEVVDFYNRGGGQGLGIDLPHQTLPFDQLQLTAQEASDLVAFMHTLTDTTGMTTLPSSLPAFPADMQLDARPIGGAY